MSEQPCLTCGHLIGMKDKECKSCGTKVGFQKPIPEQQIQHNYYNPSPNDESGDIKIISKGKILRRLYRLTIVISLIGLIIFTPPHIRELQRTSWKEPLSDLQFSSSEESLNLFFEASHTYRLDLIARGHGSLNCEILSEFSIQNSNNVIVHIISLTDKDKGSTDNEGFSSCTAYTKTSYEFIANDDVWLHVNVTIQSINAAWNTMSMEIYQDPKEYNTPQIQFWFIVFISTFFVTALPYIFIKTALFMFTFPARIFSQVEKQTRKQQVRKEDRVIYYDEKQD